MTTIELLNRLTDRIRTGEFLLVPTLSVSQLEVAIEKRDSRDFEDQWLEKFGSLDPRTSEIHSNETKVIDLLRETAFKSVFESTQSADMAAFVSDDFEMIGRALVLRVSDPWINGLWISYKNRNIQERIVPVDGNLHDLMSER